MEIVAMDMKLRGMYIARQLSFHGVTFKIEEVPLTKDFQRVYDESVELVIVSEPRMTPFLIHAFLFFPVAFLVGGSHAKVHGSRRTDRCGESHEEDHVGTILVGSSTVLQVSLHCIQGQPCGACGAGSYQVWKMCCHWFAVHRRGSYPGTIGERRRRTD